MEDEKFETEDFETTDDDFEMDSEDSGIGKLILGGGAVLAGIATGAAIKNRKKIKAFFDSHKEQVRLKKIDKHLADLEKLGWFEPEKETTEE